MPSPVCHVKEGVGTYQPTTNGVDTTPGATVTIGLISSAGVSVWGIECIYSDETTDHDAITASLDINDTLKTATFTAPAAGKALIFRSVVNGGVDIDGAVQPSYATTLGIFTLINGTRVLAVNERFESDAVYGWIRDINALIRTPPIGPVTDENVDANAGISYSKMGSGTQSIEAQQFDSTVNPNATCRTREPVTVDTTDATITTLDSFTMPDNCVLIWTAVVTARSSAAGMGWILTAAFRRAAGTVTQIGATNVTVLGAQGWSATIDNTGATVHVRGTGAPATSIRWACVSQRLEVI